MKVLNKRESEPGGKPGICWNLGELGKL